ncbi:hypothetical protein DEO23_02360 [Brachybacterium endophyticum]|uniref:Mycothiol-dependent maleylpyruvate isomerase metal-binding domain-containing protein n=1 Tax=Brachybacterium endophyticum TaxID=2182385 RepID=A0A2U2RP08_9MICO|nr:maleylpyruvate isomerase N-terminal domain-containing protein [Brachybacterium endophyticum]PWH07494.1 hypothetical protein DEO23_02360 [Brachybacterium endophyticum]
MTTATDLIAEEADRFADALRGPDPSAPVPTCPDWTVEDLLWHLTEVHEFWAGILKDHALTDADVEAVEAAKAPRPEGSGARLELLERRERATAALIDQLTARGDTEDAWSWFSADQTVGFTRRMQVHEAGIHRVDAELSANLPVTAISPEVAADGLDHAVAVMWAGSYDWVPDWAQTEQLATLTLAPEDADPLEVVIERWWGTRPRDGEEFSQLLARPAKGHDDADVESSSHTTSLPHATARGRALALLLWVWGREHALDRMTDGALTVDLSGDEEAVGHVRGRVAQGMD